MLAGLSRTQSGPRIRLEKFLSVLDFVCRIASTLMLLVFVYDVLSLASIVPAFLTPETRPYLYLCAGLSGFLFAYLCVTIHVLPPFGWVPARAIVDPIGANEATILEEREVSGWFDNSLQYFQRFLKLTLTTNRLIIRFNTSLRRFAILEVPIEAIGDVKLTEINQFLRPANAIRVDYRIEGRAHSFHFTSDQQDVWIQALCRTKGNAV
ncbi:MAG: hypothetical protein IT366_18035 [Candidatus Hydrogenedentes bacterium]|nr:hypothetical protein [Candidatus Hydrogenedentota bacterium]